MGGLPMNEKEKIEFLLRQLHKAGYTPYDIEFSDLCHDHCDFCTFSLKECKNWWFGAYCNEEKNVMEFFTQNTLNIDKFIPSDSPLCCKLEFNYYNRAIDLIKFVQYHPQLAFYYDNSYGGLPACRSILWANLKAKWRIKFGYDLKNKWYDTYGLLYGKVTYHILKVLKVNVRLTNLACNSPYASKWHMVITLYNNKDSETAYRVAYHIAMGAPVHGLTVRLVYKDKEVN
jgi:hypothetical protein